MSASSPLVLVPTCSRFDLLPGAVSSAGELPVLVVDDSPGGLPRGLLPGRPGLHLLRAGGSSGFARAVNAGLHWAEAHGHTWVLLLNDDARLLPGAASALLAAARAEPRAAALGAVLLAPSGKVESAGIRYHPRSARLRARRRAPPPGSPPLEVDALSGACLLLPSHLRFDERFPFGMEDVEFCLRLRAAGRRVLLVPAARCLHLGGATVPRRSPEAARHALAGHLLLAGPSRLRRGLVLGYALGQWMKEGGGLARLQALARGWSDAREAARSPPPGDPAGPRH